MSIHKDISGQIKDAMKAKDTVRLTVVRGLLAAFTNELVAKGRKPDGELTDEEALAVIKRGVKQRKDSSEQFRKGAREELAKKEDEEMAMLMKYLPQMMEVGEVKKIAE